MLRMRLIRPMALLTGGALEFALLCCAPGAWAQTRPAFAAPGGGQAGLALGADAKGSLRAKLCSREPCSVEGGLDLGLPPEYKRELSRAKLAIVGIGAGRRAILATVPGATPGRAFQAIVVAPLGGDSPKVVFAGLTGLMEGVDGVRQGRTITVLEPDETGARAVVIGDERDDLNLCGRPAVLDPEFLNPADLTFRPARFQRLSQPEREKAVRLRAVRGPTRAPLAGGGGLSVLGATSALGAPQFLTDGRPETAWTENRGGSGRGEFVMMSAPRNLPITAFDWVLTTPGAKPDPANVPRELWIVTRAQLYHVTFPAEAANEPGARFRATLPKPDRTDCIAQVLESSFVERASARVSVAELGVASEFEGASPTALVGAIRAGGERALAAASALSELGMAGFTELGTSFQSLDEQGRRIALDVMDRAPCELSVPVYMTALAGNVEAHRLHAESRLRRCGRRSADALSVGLRQATGEVLARFANELALAAPDRAVSELTRALGSVKSAERRVLRVALARATAAPGSSADVRRLLADAGLPDVATLDLLRALGDRVPRFLPEASAALGRLRKDASFRTRYLLVEPASILARTDPAAREVLELSLKRQSEADTWIRLRAVELAPREPARAPAFLAALSDNNVRIREAAAQAIGQGRFETGSSALIELLEDDPWPIARGAAAAALGTLLPEPQGDKALLAALSDDAPTVRAASAASLGARRVASAATELLDRLEDAKERFEVRQAAASALGALCDNDSADTLWKLVRRIDDPLATPEERAIGEASLGALVRIAPADLGTKLEPLRRGKAQKAVERALARSQKRCTRH